MTTIPLLFITTFILVQCALGLVLLYRGYTLLMAHFEVESLKNLSMVVNAQFRSIVSLVNWRRAALLLLLVAPGSIPLLLMVAGWRAFRRAEPGTLRRVSIRWWKTAMETIAL